MGMERIVLLMEQNEKDEVQVSSDETDLYLAALGPDAMEHCTLLAHLLRKNGVKAAMDYSDRGLKAQLKQANRVNARYALILGEEEWQKKEAILRDMQTQEQIAFALDIPADEQCQRLTVVIHNN